MVLGPKSIRGKLIFAFLTALGPALGLAGVHQWHDHVMVRDLAYAHQRDVALAVATSVSHYVERMQVQQKARADLMALRPYSEVQRAYPQGGIEAMGQSTRAELDRLQDSSTKLNVGTAGRTQLSDLAINAEGEPSFRISTVIRFADGTPAALVREAYGHAVVSRIPNAKDAAGWHVCALLNRAGKLVALSAKHSDDEAGPPVYSISRRSGGTKPDRLNCSVCGDSFVSASAAVPGTGWTVLVGEAKQSAFAGMRGPKLWLGGLWVASALGLIVVFVTGNRIARPIRRLALAADAIAAGDYRKSVRIRTGDELEMLGETFNKLSHSLTEHEASARAQAEMLAATAEAARIASSCLDISECAKLIAKAMRTHLGAHDAAVYRKEADSGEIKLIGHSGAKPRSAWKLVARRATESGEYLAIAERTQSGESDEEAQAFLVGVPLSAGESTLGAIVARFTGEQSRAELRLGSVRSEMFTAYGIHAAAAVANADTFCQTERYSEVLEDWVEHLSSVMQVTDAISPSLTLDETLAALARTTTEVLNVDSCAIWLPDAAGDLVMRGSHGWKDDAVATLKIHPGEAETWRAFADKKTVCCRNTLRSKCALTRSVSASNSMRALLSTPLIVEERVIGAITVYSHKKRQFAPREIRLLTSIGLHTAVIVRNASLYTRESSIAEALQSNLLSEAPDYCNGLTFASRYIPASDEASVGGDYYEVTPLPNGKVGVVIADVSGKGLSAAIHLAACKYMLKPLMYANPDNPAAVLSALNDAVNYYFDMSFFVTVFYAVVDPSDRSIRYANAGHLPGLLISDAGKLHAQLPATGVPVGSGRGCRYDTATVCPGPDDLLLLYTDGVTDTVSQEATMNVEALHAVVFGAGACSAANLIDHICHRLRSDPNSGYKDDVAMIAMSFGARCAPCSDDLGGTSGEKPLVPASAA